MDGQLAEHFEGVGAKRVSATEAAAAGVSRGHELSANGPVLSLLGRERREIECRYLYFSDAHEPGGFIEDDSTVKLYDARENKADRSPEWRLYYPAGCAPMESMQPGDYCWVAARKSGGVVIAVAEMGTSTARQLDRLFGTDLRLGLDEAPKRAKQFGLFDLGEAGDEDLDLADADLLLALGVTPSVATEADLDAMVAKFGGSYPFPSTAVFTAYARKICAIDDPASDPDATLVKWVSKTNELYFTYERHVLQPILDKDLAGQESIDIDVFFALATRFKNARFSRAGKSFEHHIAALFDASGVRYGQPPRMADGSKPDFLLPSVDAYSDMDVDVALLTFLAAKTTTKERWRQIVTEATRIPRRHLITMDRELNAAVLDSMMANGVVPVIPAPIRNEDYTTSLAARMIPVADFLKLVRSRQERAIRDGILAP